MLKNIPNIWLLQLLLVGSFFFGIPAANAAVLKNTPSGGENSFFTNLSLPKSPKRDGLNWYGYVGGDPINYVDPIGYFQNDIFMSGVGVDGIIGNYDNLPTTKGTIQCSKAGAHVVPAAP